MLTPKYQVVYRQTNEPVATNLFDRPIDAENFINLFNNVNFKKSEVLVIPVFVAE